VLRANMTPALRQVQTPPITRDLSKIAHENGEAVP